MVRCRPVCRAAIGDFRVREAAWLQMQALKDDDDDKKESKPKSSGKADRSSGKYDDIRKAQEEDRSKGSKTAQSFKNKKPEKGWNQQRVAEAA